MKCLLPVASDLTQNVIVLESQHLEVEEADLSWRSAWSTLQVNSQRNPALKKQTKKTLSQKEGKKEACLRWIFWLLSMSFLGEKRFSPAQHSGMVEA